MGDIPEKAVNRAVTAEYLENQCSKLGGTVYFPGNITVNVDDGLSVSAAQLNELRRKAIENVSGKILEKILIITEYRLIFRLTVRTEKDTPRIQMRGKYALTA